MPGTSALRIRLMLAVLLLLGMAGCWSCDSPQQVSADVKPSSQPAALVASPASAPQDQTPWLGRQLVYSEVQKKAHELGSNPDGQLRFVSGLDYDAYRGALRGPRGVLLAGAGNATDKSLLLRELLRAGNPAVSVRFAFCTLPNSDAEQLVARALADRNPPAPVSPAAPASPSNADPEAKAAAQRILAAWQTLLQSTRQDAGSLSSLLVRNGVAPAFATPHDDLLSAAAQHVWLQYRQGDAWVDLDSTLGEVGKHRCTPESTADALPETVYHHLGISIRVEERRNGTLQSRYLMETFWRTAELSGSNINYTHAETFGLDSPAKTAAPPGFYRYTPLLSIDNEYAMGDPFFLPGAPARGGVQSHPAGGAFGALGGALSGIGDSGSGAPAPAPPPTGEATALWLDFDLQTPDGNITTIDWPIFDRIGYVARAYGEQDSTPAAPASDTDGALARLSAVWNVGVWEGESTFADMFATASTDVSDVREGLDGLGTLHRSFYLGRQQLLAAAGADPKTRFVAVAPSLSVMTVQSAAEEDSGEVSVRIVRLSDRPLILPKVAPAAAALWAVASVQAEHYTASAPGVVSGEANSAAPVPDVVAILEADQKAQVPLRLLRPADAHKALELDASDEARARMYQELAGGKTVLTAEKAPVLQGQSVLGWWLVDPRSGFVNDEMEWGGHEGGAVLRVAQDDTEMPPLEGDAAGEEEPARRFGDTVCKSIAYSVFAIAAIVGAKSGNPADIVDAINKGMGLTKKEADCKLKQKKGRAVTTKTSPGPAPPPKPPASNPPRTIRRLPGATPNSPPPAPVRNIPQPDRPGLWGFGNEPTKFWNPGNR